MLILAYHSFVLAGATRRIAALLQYLCGARGGPDDVAGATTQSRVDDYVAVGEFGLLVRLLLGIPEYHEMEKLFRLLVTESARAHSDYVAY